MTEHQADVRTVPYTLGAQGRCKWRRPGAGKMNTHTKGAFCGAFEPERARALVRRIEFRCAPKRRQLAECGGMRVERDDPPVNERAPHGCLERAADAARGLVHRCQRAAARNGSVTRNSQPFGWPLVSVNPPDVLAVVTGVQSRALRTASVATRDELSSLGRETLPLNPWIAEPARDRRTAKCETTRANIGGSDDDEPIQTKLSSGSHGTDDPRLLTTGIR